MFGIEVDPEDILEGLKGRTDEGKDEGALATDYQRQKDALELFNMDILTCDNVDVIFQKYRPGTFLPALCHVFMDINAPLEVLESAARAITYFLDVHVDSTARKVVEVNGAVKAFCKALVLFPIKNSDDLDTIRMSRDVAEQSVKVLELLCRREARAVFEADGLQSLLHFVNANASTLHNDTLQSSLSVASMLCRRLKADHPAFSSCVASLTAFLDHKDTVVVDHAIESLSTLVDMLSHVNVDLKRLNEHGLVDSLIKLMATREELDHGEQDIAFPIGKVVHLLLSLLRGSKGLAEAVLKEPIVNAIRVVLAAREDEKTSLAVLSLMDLIVTFLFKGYDGIQKSHGAQDDRTVYDDSHSRDLGAIDAIRNNNLEALIEAIENGTDVNFADPFGQTILVWVAYSGTEDMAEYLILNGADPNLGRNPPLHYAARFGRPKMVELLLRHGAEPLKVDLEGKTALDQARSSSNILKEGQHEEVIRILEAAELNAKQNLVSNPGMLGNDESEDEDPSQNICEYGDHVVGFLVRFLPILVRRYQNTMQMPVRKNAITLISKMISLCSRDLLSNLLHKCAADWESDESVIISPVKSGSKQKKSSYSQREFGNLLVDFLAMVLPADEEIGFLKIGIKIVTDVMRRCPDDFFHLLLREGIVNNVEMLASNSDSNPKKQDLAYFAKNVLDKYFTKRTATPIGLVADLRSVCDRIIQLFIPGVNGLTPTSSEIEAVLQDLVRFLQVENMVSPFELENAGVIEALIVLLLYKDPNDEFSNLEDSLIRRRTILMTTLLRGSNSEGGSPLVTLLRKLQTILSCIERLPIYSHSASNSSCIDCIKTPLNINLRRAPGEKELLDWTGKTLKIEPLVTVSTIEEFLLRRVVPQWYDHDRNEMNFVRILQDDGRKNEFVYSRDFDKNGVIYFIGSNGCSKEWINPASHGLVFITSSDGRTLPYGKVEDILSRSSEAQNCHTKDRSSSWFVIDLGLNLIPSAYTLRHACGYGRSALRAWQLQMSTDGMNWATIKSHDNDQGMVEPGSTYTWILDAPETVNGWRYVRIMQTGRNAGGKNYLSLSGFEIYGTVTSVALDRPGKQLMEIEASARLEARRQVHKFQVGTKVVRGFDWKWGSQDGGQGEVGEVQTEINEGWVEVRWENGESNRYRMGAQNSYDLKLYDDSIPSPADSDEEVDDDTEGNVTHSSVQCDGCVKFPLVGHRFRCSVCKDYDLCEGCYWDDVHAEEGHTFYVIRKPGAKRHLLPCRQISHFESSFTDRSHAWESNVTLKREFSSLEAAFDPRRNRTTTEQPVTLEIEDPGAVRNNARKEVRSTEKSTKQRLALFISMPSDANSVRISCDAIHTDRAELLDLESTIFRVVHKKFYSSRSAVTCASSNKIWDTTFTITYRLARDFDDPHAGDNLPWTPAYVAEHLGSDNLAKGEVILCMQERATAEWLRLWRLSGNVKQVAKRNNCSKIIAAYTSFYGDPVTKSIPRSINSKDDATFDGDVYLSRQEILLSEFMASHGLSDKVSRILQFLKIVNESLEDLCSMHQDIGQELINQKLSNKLKQQLSDPLAITSGSMPKWCHEVVTKYAPVFPFEIRFQYFAHCSFGVDRAVAAIQLAQDKSPERMRQRANARTREEDTSRSLGQLKQERVVVKRGNQILEWAMSVMKVHAKRKAILEVTFADEEGHGSGVTNEFYSLVSDALQRRDLGMWICDDLDNSLKKNRNSSDTFDTEIALSPMKKAKAKTDGDMEIAFEINRYVHRDCGLFPAPLPPDAPNKDAILEKFRFLGTFLAKALLDNRLISLPLASPLFKILCHYPLNASDLAFIDPEKARHLAQLHEVAVVKKAADLEEDSVRKQEMLQSLPDVEVYCLTMQYAPSSTIHGFRSYDLIPDGGSVTVDIGNVHEYVERMYNFMLDEGISEQIAAIREGISEVFPESHLKAFTPSELRSMLSGDSNVSWSKIDLLEHLEPRNGYDIDSSTFQHLVHVLCDLDERERKDFLRFVTGVRVLPPGGLKNLDPKLTVVRKHCENDPDDHFPSANTCFHFLKLPEYSSTEILASRLKTALQHGMDGFYFN